MNNNINGMEEFMDKKISLQIRFKNKTIAHLNGIIHKISYNYFIDSVAFSGAFSVKINNYIYHNNYMIKLSDIDGIDKVLFVEVEKTLMESVNLLFERVYYSGRNGSDIWDSIKEKTNKDFLEILTKYGVGDKENE